MASDLVLVGLAAAIGAGLGSFVRGFMLGAKAVGLVHRLARSRRIHVAERRLKT